MDVKIFAENVEEEALQQIYTLAEHPAFDGAKIRIMPDVHAGKGCVIGFTANLGDKAVPNLVGVDIGCGMYTVNLGQLGSVDFAKLDTVIRENVPSGLNVHDDLADFDGLDNLYCKGRLKNMDWLRRSMGTLGGGNHFIEVDVDEAGIYYLIIHTGSRNLGKQVADIYQHMAVKDLSGKDTLAEKQEQLIAEYKKDGREQELEDALRELRNSFQWIRSVPKDLCYLTGVHREMYLHDMMICADFARENRERIASAICKGMGWKQLRSFHTVHNYIERETGIIRKGAISAYDQQPLLIPMNMRDGCLLCYGKGNPDWNWSAPHGAGRLMSRAKAKNMLTMEQFKTEMANVYTTCVVPETLDESPMAYKPMGDIVDKIADTAEILNVLKPVYNYKAGE